MRLIHNQHGQTGTIVIVVLLIGFLFVSGVLDANALINEIKRIIGSNGQIVPNGEAILVNVSSSNQVNKLSFGSNFDWQNYRRLIDVSQERQLALDAKLKLYRMNDYRKSLTPRLAPCLSWNDTTLSGSWNWSEVDTFTAQVYALGGEPLIALGWAGDTSKFPTEMTITSTGLPSPTSWAAYCRAWVAHFKMINRPVKYYEVTNEPWKYFGMTDYSKLYNFMQIFTAASNAMHQENPNVLVSFDGTNRKGVLDYFLQNNVQLGFISFHKYDEPFINQYSLPTMLNLAETFQLTTTFDYYGVKDAKQTYFNKYGVWLQCFDTETNYCPDNSIGTDPTIQKLEGATWLALNLKTSIIETLDGVFYYDWASSASYQQTFPSGLGYGMVNMDNSQPYYPYYVLKLLSSNLNVNDSIISSSNPYSDIEVLAWKNQNIPKLLVISTTSMTNTIQIVGLGNNLLINKIDSNSLGIQTETSNNTLVLHGYTIAIIQSSGG